MAITKRALMEMLESLREEDLIEFALTHDAVQGDFIQPLHLDSQATVDFAVVSVGDPYYCPEPEVGWGGY